MRLRFVGGFLEKAGEEVADFLRGFRIAGFGKSNARGGFEKAGKPPRAIRRAGSVRLRFAGGFLEKAGEEVADFLRRFRIAGFGKSNASGGFEKAGKPPRAIQASRVSASALRRRLREAGKPPL